MFSDRMNWIVWIFFSASDEAEKTQFRFTGKNGRGINNKSTPFLEEG